MKKAQFVLSCVTLALAVAGFVCALTALAGKEQ